MKPGVKPSKTTGVSQRVKHTKTDRKCSPGRVKFMGENRKKRNAGGLSRPPSVQFRSSMETPSMMKMSKSKNKKVVGNQRGSALFVGTSGLPSAGFAMTLITMIVNL